MLADGAAKMIPEVTSIRTPPVTDTPTTPAKSIDRTAATPVDEIMRELAIREKAPEVARSS
jgi:hypothetical protein